MANKSIKDAFQRFWEYVTAKIDDQIMVVTVTKNGDTYTADKTFAEVIAKLNAGGKCEAILVDGSNKTVLPSVLTYSSSYVFFGSTTYGSGLGNTTVSIKEDNTITHYFRGIVPQSGGTFTGAVKTGTASTSGYYVRNIKFSETAETPTNEGDICFKLK